MSVLFNMLSIVGHSFSSKEQTSFNLMAAINICSDFGAQENKICHCFQCFPINLPWSDGTRCHDHSVLNVEFQANFFTLLFHFHQEALWFFSLSAIRVVSSAYLRLLIFYPAILITACASSSTAFLKMYSAHKLNKQGDNIQPWLTPFPIWNQSVVPCQVCEIRDIVQEAGIKTVPKKNKCKKARWLSEETLQIAVKRRKVKSKGEKEKYTYLNAEFQRIARRD